MAKCLSKTVLPSGKVLVTFLITDDDEYGTAALKMTSDYAEYYVVGESTLWKAWLPA